VPRVSLITQDSGYFGASAYEGTIAVRWPDWPRWLMIWPPEYPEHDLERHPAAPTEWSRHLRDADFDDSQWIDPAFRPIATCRS
jgi:hypothetical protein